MKSDVPVLSGGDLAAAIRAFTDAQWIRLRKVAEKYAWLYPAGAEDLLYETIGRALAGDRECPLHLDPVKFLAEAMRSVADGEANLIENQIEVVPIVQPGDPVDQAVDPVDSHMNSEERMEAAENTAAFRQAMLGLFPNDQQARDLVDGIMEGYEGQELRDITGLDDKIVFASKRRLVRRTIDKHFPTGWKP